MAPAEKVRTGPRVAVADEIEIATYHLGGDGPPLMMLHATGFHGRSWATVAPSLTPHFTVWAVDHRGHGSSGKTKPGGLRDWSRFVDDLLVVIDTLGGDRWHGLGHSLGGTVLLLGEARRPGTFEALCCYEPVIFEPDVFQAGDGRGISLGDLARKRRSGFESRQAALGNYRAKPPFNRFDPETLELYVKFGLVDAPDGTVTLACRREDEASVFDGAPDSGGLSALDEVGAPVCVLSGVDNADPVSRMAELVAARLRNGRSRRLKGLDHFGPLCAPRLVGDEAALALVEAGSGSPSTVPPPR